MGFCPATGKPVSSNILTGAAISSSKVNECLSGGGAAGAIYNYILDNLSPSYLFSMDDESGDLVDAIAGNDLTKLEGVDPTYERPGVDTGSTASVGFTANDTTKFTTTSGISGDLSIISVMTPRAVITGTRFLFGIGSTVDSNYSSIAVVNNGEMATLSGGFKNFDAGTAHFTNNIDTPMLFMVITKLNDVRMVLNATDNGWMGSSTINLTTGTMWINDYSSGSQALPGYDQDTLGVVNRVLTEQEILDLIALRP